LIAVTRTEVEPAVGDGGIRKLASGKHDYPALLGRPDGASRSRDPERCHLLNRGATSGVPRRNLGIDAERARHVPQ
jgi:hypothetical protein